MNREITMIHSQKAAEAAFALIRGTYARRSQDYTMPFPDLSLDFAKRLRSELDSESQSQRELGRVNLEIADFSLDHVNVHEGNSANELFLHCDEFYTLTFQTTDPTARYAIGRRAHLFCMQIRDQTLTIIDHHVSDVGKASPRASLTHVATFHLPRASATPMPATTRSTTPSPPDSIARSQTPQQSPGHPMNSSLSALPTYQKLILAFFAIMLMGILAWQGPRRVSRTICLQTGEVREARSLWFVPYSSEIKSRPISDWAVANMEVAEGAKTWAAMGTSTRAFWDLLDRHSPASIPALVVHDNLAAIQQLHKTRPLRFDTVRQEYLNLAGQMTAQDLAPSDKALDPRRPIAEQVDHPFVRFGQELAR